MRKDLRRHLHVFTLPLKVEWNARRYNSLRDWYQTAEQCY